METTFNSLTKQQQVNTEFQSLWIAYFAAKLNGNSLLGFRSMVAHIEKRFPLCLSKVDFLRQAQIIEDWARKLPRKIDNCTTIRDLNHNLPSILQVESEASIRSGTKEPSHLQWLKPQIFITSPKYAKRIAKKLFPGQEYDRSFWTCRPINHRLSKCLKKLNPAKIAAQEAKWLATKKK